MPKYPRPDRSEFEPNFRKSEEHPALDLGWAEGKLRDGRPWRAECWAEDGVTSLTFFLSTIGIEKLTDAEFAALLEAEGLLRFTGIARYVAARPLTDPSGNEMWSVNVVVGDDEDTFVEDRVALRPYYQPRSSS
ncbi:MAG TPA: hypothetical protein VG432_05690 [Gemmatimonadaceae bacterium]|nr:hypothetical protein [Gemmatimonadaceae bacterium]